MNYHNVTDDFLSSIGDNVTRDEMMTSQEPENVFLSAVVTGVYNTSNTNTNLSLDILKKSNYIIFPIFLILGLTGNILTIIIMNSRGYHHVTSRYYLISLAVSDSILLLLQVFNKNFVIEILGRDIRAACFVCCKMFFVFFRTSKMVSSWFVVCLCLERFIAVWFPLKARELITKRGIFIQIASIVFVIGGLNSVWSYASHIESDGFCHPDSYDRNDDAEKFKFMTFLTIAACLYSFIPSLILIIFSPLIIYQLAKYRKVRKTLTNKTDRTSNDNVRISVMLIGIVIAFVILVTPVILLHMIANYKGMNAFGNNGVAFTLYLEIAQILEQLNYSINFGLYILTSSQFRKKCFELLGISTSKPKAVYGAHQHDSRKELRDSERKPKDSSIVFEDKSASETTMSCVENRQNSLDIYDK